ncbi:TPA: hypothetical protein ACWP3N_005432, partial [Escherichia coli]
LANKKSRMFPEPNNEKAPGHAGARWSARLSFWRYILVFDIVKSPKVTISIKGVYMASFTVRVELVGASSDDYNRLHEAMESRRYFREIQDGAGNWFYLPDAEYTAEKNASARAVRDEVVAIAGTIKKNPRVLVTQAADRSWHLIKK